MNIFEKITYANYALNAVNTVVAGVSYLLYEDTKTSEDLNPLNLDVNQMSHTVPWIILAVDGIAMIVILCMTNRKYRPVETERDKNIRMAAMCDNTGSFVYLNGCVNVTHDCLTQAVRGGRVTWGQTGGLLGIGVMARIGFKFLTNKMIEPETVAEAMEAVRQREMTGTEALLAVVEEA